MIDVKQSCYNMITIRRIIHAKYGAANEACPFEFNFDPATFKVGDMVSYRVPDPLGDFPFVGTIVAVYDDYIEILAGDFAEPDKRMRGTRESRPIVSAAEAL